MTKKSSNNDSSILLYCNTTNGVVKTQRRIEAAVNTPISIQPHDPVTFDLIVGLKITRDNDPTIPLHHNGMNRKIRPITWVKAFIQGPLTIDSGDALSGNTVKTGKVTHNDGPAVRLNKHVTNRVIGTSPGVECIVDRAITVQTHDSVSVDTVNCGKVANRHNPTIRLNTYRLHGFVKSCASIERGVDGSICVQAHDSVSCQPVHKGKVTPQEKPPINLLSDAVHKIIGPGCQVETGVNGTGRFIDCFIIQHGQGRHVGRSQYRLLTIFTNGLWIGKDEVDGFRTFGDIVIFHRDNKGRI